MSPTIAECLEHARQCEWYAARTIDLKIYLVLVTEFLPWRSGPVAELARQRISRVMD